LAGHGLQCSGNGGADFVSLALDYHLSGFQPFRLRPTSARQVELAFISVNPLRLLK
jgi:hypothetical protein